MKEVVTFSLWGFQQEQLLSIVTAFLISLCFGFYKKVESVQKIFFHAALCGLISAQVYQVSNKLTANNLWIDLAGVIVGLVGVDYIQSLLKRVLEGAINRFNPKI